MYIASGIDSFLSTVTASKIALDPTYAQTAQPVATFETAYLVMLALIGIMILLRRRHRIGSRSHMG